MQKSPSGSLCPYYFQGGELHPLKYGGFHGDEARLLAVMQAEEAFILRSARAHNRRIWIDLYETRLTGGVLDALAAHIQHIEGKIGRLCLVGCGVASRWRFKRRMARLNRPLAARVRFFADPEAAKHWLVREA